MTPPINIDGTQITGASIDGTDVSAITVDGTTVFSAIPNSAIHQWKLDDVGSGTATDSVGSADGSVSGVSSVSGTFVGGSAGSSDGNDDLVDFGTLGSFGSDMDTDFAIIATIQTTDENQFFGGVENSGDSTQFELNSGRIVSDGALGVTIQDASGNTLRTATGTNTGLTDGNKHRFGFNKTGNSASGIEYYIDGSQDTVEVDTDQTISNPSNFDRGFYLYGVNAGSLFAPIDATLDNVIFTDNSLTATEFQNDFDNQPWS